jgi:hypothetical protein
MMIRFAAATALVLLNTSAFSQKIDSVKGIKFGVGCVGPVTTFAPPVWDRAFSMDQRYAFGAQMDKYSIEPESPLNHTWHALSVV